MLHVVTGLFHPDLEQALASDLRSVTTPPSSPCLVLVPSESLRTYLKWVFCIEKGLPLFNVHLLTFHQLAARLLEEQGRQVAARLRGESFFREWVHQRLRRRDADFTGLNELASMPGGWAALWATLKDLKDARVDAGAVLEAFGQSPFSADCRLQAVIRLYRTWCEDQDRHSLYDHDDLAVLALDLISESSWLRQQARIFYYGFYDLTQGQLDLFQTIVRQYPITLYFPLLDQHPAFRFAQQFFDQHIRGLATGTIEHKVETTSPFRDLFDPSRESGSQKVSVPEALTADDAGARGDGTRHAGAIRARETCRLITVSGVNDEIDVVAKEILALAHERQIPFHDVGVVGRTLTGYEDVLPRVFSAHGIPFQATLRRPLNQYPFAQILLRLLGLRLPNSDRNATFDVLHSPFVHWQTFCPDLATPRPGVWEQLSREVGLEQGPRDRERLVRFFETGVLMPHKRRQGEDTIPGEEIRNFWRVLDQLTHLLEKFPEKAGWDVFTDLAVALMDRVLMRPSSDLDAHAPQAAPGAERTAGVYQAIRECFAEIQALTDVSGPVLYAEFHSTLTRFMEERLVRNPSQAENGVRVVDAMAARGLSFRYLFVIGLTDHVFPRHIREDGFFRDSARRFLDVNLGFKVQEKTRGYDEEKLLFYLLMHAAREGVTLLAQRSDEEGRTTIPSWYLQEVERCVPGLAAVDVPRSALHKSQAISYADEARWTPRERLVRHVLQRHEPVRATAGEPAWWRILENGLAALHEQESDRPHLNAYDGVTGPLPEYWKGLALSATSLQRYATCPFQYFVQNVLGLHVSRPTSRSQGPGPLEVGTLLHEILGKWYDRLERHGWFAGDAPPDCKPLCILKQVAEMAFREFEQQNSAGPALLWEMRQEQIVTMLERILEQDKRELGNEWRPILFEEPVKGEMPVKVAKGTTSLSVTGRLDRVDWSSSRRRYRIIDYKFTGSNVMTDQALAKAVVQGTRLQPLLYMELAGQGIPPLLEQKLGLGKDGQATTVEGGPCAAPACEGVWFYVVAPRELPEEQGFAPVAFTAETRAGVVPQTETLMTTLVEGIRQGKFFIVPGRHCDWCDVRAVCHLTHPASARRAREDYKQIRAHRNVRRQQPPKPSAKSVKKDNDT
ncbi:MAG: PD-(D/E)XK nuclease family protein [Nitrospira sp.]|nr:PD-(D/E)XK nuclease family protein [Nitrospira sp.]